MSGEEILEQLGYKKIIDNEYYLFFERENFYRIEFYKENKRICCTTTITMQELKAIYQICKEKGWLDE